MKFFSLAALLALAVASTDAELCTIDDVYALEKKPEVAAVGDACQYKKVDELIPKTDAETKDICAKNKECVKAIAAAKPVVASTCELSGDDLLYHFTHAHNRLDSLCAKVAASSSSSAASAGAVTTAVLAVAMAAVAYV